MTTRSLVAALFLLTSLGCTEKKKDGPVDFIQLVSEAYPKGGGRNDDKTEELWLELNKLPQWHFTTTKDLVAQKQPSIELVADGSWLIVSTDLNLARAYAMQRGRALAQPAKVDAGELPPSPFANPTTPTLDAPVAAPDAAAAPPNPYLADDGKPLVITMTPDEAVAYLEGYSGPPLTGVRFNEGAARGFFGDVKAVVRIRSGLKANGSLGAKK